MSNTIRCKMTCHEASLNPHTQGMSTVRFGAVYKSGATGQPDDENAVFGKLTPYGELRLGMVTEVAEQLEVGQEYYLDIIKAN